MTEETEENAGASEDSSMSFAAAEARKALIEEMGDSGFVRPAGMQNSAYAVLKDIQPMRELFQPREEYESHVKDLMDALKVHGELDPILVGHTASARSSSKVTTATPRTSGADTSMSPWRSNGSRARWMRRSVPR